MAGEDEGDNQHSETTLMAQTVSNPTRMTEEGYQDERQPVRGQGAVEDQPLRLRGEYVPPTTLNKEMYESQRKDLFVVVLTAQHRERR